MEGREEGEQGERGAETLLKEEREPRILSIESLRERKLKAESHTERLHCVCVCAALRRQRLVASSSAGSHRNGKMSPPARLFGGRLKKTALKENS